MNPALHRVPFPSPVRSLPGRTIAYLAVLAAAFAGTALLSRRRGLGQVRSLLALGGVSAVGSSLLFLPGVLGEPFRIDRLVVEERLQGAATARRVEILRVERLRRSGPDLVATREPGATYEEIRYSEDSVPAWKPDGAVRLAAPGRYALLAGVSGVDTPSPAGPFLATVLVDGDRAWVRIAETPDLPGEPAREGPGLPLADALASLRRSGDARVSRAGALLARLFRPPPPAGHGAVTIRYLLAVPASGPDAIVVHLPR